MTDEKVSLADLVGAAVRMEFASVFQSVGVTLNGNTESWTKAGAGVLAKIEAALQTPKTNPMDYTVPEIHLLNLTMKSLGWDPNSETRINFIRRLHSDAVRSEGD